MDSDGRIAEGEGDNGAQEFISDLFFSLKKN